MINETYLFLFLFLTFTVCDMLLFYTYLVSIDASIKQEIKIFFNQRWFLFVLNNLLHSILILLFYRTKDLVCFLLLLFNLLIYLYPNFIKGLFKSTTNLYGNR